MGVVRGGVTEKSENGEKDEFRFALYTLLTLSHVTIYLYLFGYLHFLNSPLRNPSYAFGTFWNVPVARVKGFVKQRSVMTG